MHLYMRVCKYLHIDIYYIIAIIIIERILKSVYLKNYYLIFEMYISFFLSKSLTFFNFFTHFKVMN